MNEIVDVLIEKKDSSHLRKAIPFMSREKVQIINELSDDDLDLDDED